MNDNARKIPLHEYALVIVAWLITISFALYIVLTVKEALIG